MMNVHKSIVGRAADQRGVALITALLVTLLMSALMIGFTSVVMSDQRYRFYDRDRVRAFYGAHSGLEKLNSELANLFFVNVAPTNAQIAALKDNPPAIPGVTFVTEGTAAYGVTAGASSSGQISTGPYQGLMALKKTYDIESSVRTDGGGEAHLRRSVETVAIPVFQFGMFSDVDLSFHAGPNFNFGGRVHTNGNLFLAEGDGNQLTLPERVTAVKEVIRKKLVNGVAIGTSGHQGTVRIATAPGAYRNLATTEGSLIDSVGSALNDPTWTNVSLSAYNSNIRNGRTGAKSLNLPIMTTGGSNPDLLRRPAANEDATNPTLFGERYFGKVSLRILLSDTAVDITNLPTVTATPPIQLDGDWVAAPPNNGVAYGPIDAAHPPIARTRGPIVAPVPTIAGVAGTTLNVSDSSSLRPSIRVGGALVTTCSQKTANSFTGCTGTPAAPAGTVVTAPSGLTTTTTAAIAAGAATIPVVSTTSFVPWPFWIGTNTNLVTCTGWTAASFTNCSGLPNPLPAAGTALTTNALSAANTGLIGGFIKIERQDPNHAWHDVTMEVLNYGIGAPNLSGTLCADPTPNAILRIQQLRDNAAAANGCTYAGSTSSYDYWPSMLFDPREALYRDVAPGANLLLGGVIHYITIDVANLSRWFSGAAPYGGGTGPNSITDNGFSVYFSDRRNNKNLVGQETGEYGFEDIVNPASATGAPNGALDEGEDVNANGTLETYGQFPSYNGVMNTAPPGALAPLDATARPATAVPPPQARVNRALLFRRALKLINGSLGNIVAPGLTIASEDPVYIQGDWNANQSGFGNPHVATSILADAVTLLSNNWNDNNSFSAAYSPAGGPTRTRSAQSYYRFAVIAGKNAPFARPTVGGVPQDFGTDGGAHNFLRMLEQGGTVNYRGSIATFYYSRQAVGVYKCCATVYGAPTRNYNFDTDFLDPAKLPPLTPVFRDLNSLGFTQEIRPGL